ncbi:uncharacterized protein LTR77_005043 [Saxophila tyrrhenica]|uniref:Major facilitator superfamily (MFS) profile domain-containing protein n=1 Tax=Saxophila tyrrhenica TaxID=1690608 RepID=A0AAV9PBK6_9PEZI|nr:hypothetical protein LTR77_005043 [Saxophila tyrrhenica]
MAGESNHENVDVFRRGSVSTLSECEPLLPDGHAPALYKTISHVNEITKQANGLTDDDEGAHVKEVKPRAAGVYTTLSVLLLGVFVSQTDQSFVLATYGAVSSEFDDLESGSWLISAYILAQCVAQPLYGRMADIYGRKACLQASYILFAIGTTVSGLGQNMGQVIAGRAIQGAGGAGMVSMVSIVVTDLVPLQEVATLWGYVNILQTTGRSCGGLIGGLLTQTLGWRWAFLVQVPPVVIAIILVQWRLQLPTNPSETESSKWEKLKRVDFIGAFFLCYTIFAACFTLDVGGRRLPWDSPVLIGMLISGIASAILFVASAKHVKEPIFPLRLLTHYDTAMNYLVVLLQCMVQFALMMSVPVYFQATRHATTAAAGAYLIPAFVGNTLGGLLAGVWIRKTGRYKYATVLAPILAGGCMLLCLLRWNGTTGVWESLYIFPGGFATGMVTSSAFVGMAAGIDESDIAVAGSGMYLFISIGAVAGASAGGAVYQLDLRSGLEQALQCVNGGDKGLLDDIGYLWTLSDGLRQRVMPSYVMSFHRVMWLNLACCALSLIIAAVSRQNKIRKK